MWNIKVAQIATLVAQIGLWLKIQFRLSLLLNIKFTLDLVSNAFRQIINLRYHLSLIILMHYIFNSITTTGDWKPSIIAFQFMRTHFPEESYTLGAAAFCNMSLVR